VRRESATRDVGVCVCGVVLAAGRASRMGGHKVLLPIGGRAMVQRVVEASLESLASQTIVVVGHDAPAVLQAIEGRPVVTVVNPDYAAGMSTSLHLGILAADPACDAVVVLLADQPFVTAALIDALIERFALCRSPVVRPLAGTQPANPVLLSAELFPEILEERGDVGARRVVERHADQVCLVPVVDPHLCADIDSPAEYEREKDA
jgi:molybdenum cofactor cytidylyltransferase